ncbi:hypothetical protein BS47DRAFT_1368744 [Hydnum rufescens UP504]|uniref:HNH nuclease domain-containing protein n=1 Tax=Hydnum rufescens UP504 TaxID=1448309 RepID=A0A9P6AEZ2_9AGAM|nr:hypothetical protein BS47DRAFT_1368744 [Hydnum rufescens UP504]
MATLISDLDLAYNQILSASGLFIIQDSMASGRAKPTSVFVTAFLRAMLSVPTERNKKKKKNKNKKRKNDTSQGTGSYRTSIYWEALEECETDEPITPVQIGHIIPLSMNSPKKMWDVIQSYGGLQPGELTGDRINEPFNHLVFGYLEHFTFDTSGGLSFQIQNILWRRPISGTPKEGTAVKFVDHHNENDTEDLPNPRFLRLHVAVAGVIHMSGAAEYIENYLQDL